MMNTSRESTWFPYWQQKSKARIRLFCFPYAGGSASIFRNWSNQLPPEIEVCPVQLPGREHRLQEPAFSQLPPLINALANVLYPHLSMPYALVGHSMGSLISFELARHLYQAGYGSNLVHLFVSAHRAPQLPDPHPPIHHLPEEGFIDELRQLNGTPESVLQNQELRALLLPLLRADFTLCETYTYAEGEPFSCPITAFGGLHDTKISRDELSGWREHTTSTFKLRFLPGDHFFIQTEQRLILQSITQDLFVS